PAAAGAADATPVVVGPDEQDPVQVEIVGLPGSLSGRVQASGGDVATAVQVVPVVGGVRGAPVQATTTGAGGAFALAGLPTPATYELVFTAEGFAPTSRVESLRGGEQLTLDAVRLSAGDGSIAGTVTDGTSPLGGVAVTVRTGGQQAAATVTPTSGAVGTFVFPELTTPGTYLLSFERDGYGTETVAVELGPGEARTDLSVALSGGTGTITGTVVDAAGAGLGEVTVAILGGPTTVQAATLTSGQVGSWRITGLATPGDYTATFSKPGYRTEAVAVTLGTGGSAQAVDVVLTAELGAVVGAVRSADGTGLAGVQVVATDGTAERPTTSATAPRLGAYALESLPAGAYSITFSAPGHAPSTHLVHLGPGQRATLDVTLVAP
ncbi:MAG: carboxypeptidase-like regulatory domain-containing protein, partial [Acidimicrobiia bacterium]